MIKTIFLAAGCFWGVQYQMLKLDGVIDSEVGFMGGYIEHPTYEDVCRGNTGHYETVKVVYDTDKVSDEEVLKRYFEIHDFEQTDGQGPDIGLQYLSVIFYTDKDQKVVAAKLMERLKELHYKVRTRLEPATEFWPAESYHQHYYEKKSGQPYCHVRKRIF